MAYASDNGNTTGNGNVSVGAGAVAVARRRRNSEVWVEPACRPRRQSDTVAASLVFPFRGSRARAGYDQGV